MSKEGPKKKVKKQQILKYWIKNLKYLDTQDTPHHLELLQCGIRLLRILTMYVSPFLSP